MRTYTLIAMVALAALVASTGVTRADGESYASDAYEESDCQECADDECERCNCSDCSKRRHAKRSQGHCANRRGGKGHFGKRKTQGIPATGVGYGGDPPIGGHGIVRKRDVRNAALALPWHGNYYHTEWGTPVALVVPPTAERQWNLGWGVGSDRLSRTWHQFQRAYPGPYAGGVGGMGGSVVGAGGVGGQGFQATPRWPSDTSQFGVYYVRGPW